MRTLLIIKVLFFFCIFCSCAETNKLNTNTGSIEIEERKVDERQSELFKNISNIRVSFFKRYDNNIEKFGLLVVNINGVHFLADINGILERYLYDGKTYKFRFYGSGFYEQKREIKIRKGYEYYIKVIMDVKTEAMVD